MLFLGEYVGAIPGQPPLSVSEGLDIGIIDDRLHVADRDASTIEYYQLHN